MENQEKVEHISGLFNEAFGKPINRKSFIKWTGVSAAVLGFGISMNGCKSDDVVAPPNGGITFVAGDIGILNYAYALEQLEAAFYAKVINSFYTGASAAEQSIIVDIAYHEQGHRDFFKAAIPATSRIADDLTFNFSTIDFTSRASVLGAAKAFEDTGVSAYNGIAFHINDVNYVALAGKIVSVEARHSSAIRELLSPGTSNFAGNDIISSSTGLETALLPSAVIPMITQYFTVTIGHSALP